MVMRQERNANLVTATEFLPFRAIGIIISVTVTVTLSLWSEPMTFC